MPFRTDNGGMALNIQDAKISAGCSGSLWTTRLSQIAKVKGKIIIVTYSLPSLEDIKNILTKQPENVALVYHEKFNHKASAIRIYCPLIDLYPMPDCHAKIVLVEPKTVWLSSANFGKSKWFENTIGIHSREAYDYYYKKICEYVGKQL